MRFIFIAIFTFSILNNLSAQITETTFTKEWEEINSLINDKGLPKSALDKVNALYTQAKSKGLEAQQVKALLYRFKLENDITEKNINDAIAAVDTEINDAKTETVRSILLCIKATQLYNYFSNNRWKFYQRSTTIHFVKEDIETWSNDDFLQTISALYLEALSPARELYKTNLAPYDALIFKGNSRKLRPTLYDLIAHTALDYFKGADSYTTKPEKEFEISAAAALGDITVFLGIDFSSSDTWSNKKLCLQLFQQLMGFHQLDKDPSALIDVNIERIVYANENYTGDDKDSLYINVLTEITKEYGDNAVAEQAWYLLAQSHAEKAASYDPYGDTSKRYEYAEAKKIIDARLVNKDTVNEGLSNMRNLLLSITKPSLSTQVENINVSNKPFRMYVQYRNVKTMFARIIRIKGDEFENNWDENYWNKLAKLPAFKTFSQQLPDTKDFQQHSTEIKVDALPPGSYLIVASSENDFSVNRGAMIAQNFDVSNISFITFGQDYFVLDRDNGNPLSGSKILAQWKRWDYNSRRYTVSASEDYTADTNGKFSITKQSNEGSLQLTITYNNDKLKVQAPGYYNPYPYENTGQQPTKDEFEKNSAQVFYFTDRSIYRPGQTVFFKGIVTSKNYDTKQSTLYLQGKKITIRLNDVNNRTIDSIETEVNDYGSFNGKFTLPQHVLTGNFNINAEEVFNGQASFNVEEYKRPTFFIEYDTVINSYRLGDTIKITGSAKAYAGNNMDGATVTYTVQRNARFIYDWMWWRSPMPHSSKQIANGTVTTDENGKFEISFIASPDLSIDKNTEPVFNFSINASFTDNRGETREENTEISIGYKSLMLQLDVPTIAEINDFKKFGISVQNMNGVNVDADVNIKIIPLESPLRLLRSRYWQKPDQFVMDEKTYISNFPNDIYKDEDDYKSWQQKTEILNTKFECKGSTVNYELSTVNFSPGNYLIEATTHDDDGNEVKDIKYIQLYDAYAQTPPSPVYNFNAEIKNNIQPGENASMFIASSAQNNHIIQNNISIAEPAGKEECSYNYFNMAGGKKEITIPVTEASRNGQAMYYAFVKNNRYFTGGININIPDSSKDLHISYETWRDKTEPGSKEAWKVKISGSNNTKVATELLTAMYDASLDQFQPQSWGIPSLWQKPGIYSHFEGNTCFATLSSQEKYHDEGEVNYYEKIYDELMTEGNDFINGYNGRNNYGGGRMYERGGKVMMAMDATLSPTMTGTPGETSPGMLNDVVVVANKNSPRANKMVEYVINTHPDKKEPQSSQPLRKNFNETAFFFPNLYADADGSYTFSFTMPEALTKWKWMSLAHTKNLAFGYSEKNTITQKQIMVQPNLPRFLRQGDKIDLITRISNITNEAFAGNATLEILDAITNEPIDGIFENINASQDFSVAAYGSTTVKFPVSIPMNFINPIIIKIKASAGDYADGEENILPVLTNRLFITESLPLYQRGDGKKNYSFTKLLESDKAPGNLQTESVTVEYTSNPVWYVVQALPYLKNYQYDCAEQIFNSFYANALAHYIVSTNPQIKKVFDAWKADTSVIKSNLQKDEELKQLLIEATPWLNDAESETEQKKNIALLFDENIIDQSIQSLLEKLKDMQNSSGAFSWFKGGYDDRYITQYILTGIGKLFALNALTPDQKNALQLYLENAMRYLDAVIQKDYDDLVKYKIDLKNNNLGYTQMQYLLMRSYFKEMPGMPEAYNYYYNQCKEFWNKQNSYFKLMISLVLYRSEDKDFVKKNILPSILENAVTNTDGALYWKDLQNGYYWYQQPIEQQAFMIEAINEIAKGENDLSLENKVSDMQLWLIRNKQTNNWKTTKATADACYAILVSHNNLLNENSDVKICLGKTIIKPTNTEAGTGYFKQKIEGKDVTPSMGNIEVAVSSPTGVGQKGASWGAVYWQYFQDIDAVTPAATPLSLTKKLFIERNTASGKIIEPVSDSNNLKVGDKLIVRIELRSDRDMEYVHLKDIRAANMEPVNVLSSYKWQDGLGYYESTKDIATDFFISFMPKGTYIFEYPVHITHTGEFSAGIATVQCMYAPEYSSHSEGFKVEMKE